MKRGSLHIGVASTVIFSACAAAWALFPLVQVQPASQPASLPAQPANLPATLPIAPATAPALSRTVIPNPEPERAAESNPAPIAVSRLSSPDARTAGSAAAVLSTSPATTQSDFARPVDLTSTTYVTVHIKSAIMPDAASALLKAAHLGVNVDASNEPRIALQEHRDFDVDHRPLILALMDFGDAYDIDISRNAITGAWELVKRLPPPTTQPGSFDPPPRLPKAEHWAKAPVTVTGPFAVYARSITVSHAFDPLPTDDAQPKSSVTQSATLKLAFCCEPRIFVVYRGLSPVLETCEDDRGQSLIAGPAPLIATANVSANLRDLLSIDVILKMPPAGSAQIVHVGGYLPLTVVSRIAWIGFKTPLQGSWRSLVQPGIHLAIGGFADLMNGDEEATIYLYRDGVDDAQWQSQIQMLQRGAMPKIFDKLGHAVGMRGLILDRPVVGDRAVFRLRCFRKDLNGRPIADLPDRWEWEVPLEVKQMRVPFAFDHLPLPSS